MAATRYMPQIYIPQLYAVPQTYSIQSVSAAMVGPAGAYAVRLNTVQYGYGTMGGYGTPYASPGVIAGYGSAGGYGGGDPVLTRQMDALRKAQRLYAGGNDVEARKSAYDTRAGGRVEAAPEVDRLRAKPENLKVAVSHPSDADLLSGKALNAILDGLKEFDGKSLPANPPFLPPEVATAIVLVGGHSAVTPKEWSSVGVSVPDLVKHMEKFKLRFGPAVPGDEAAYTALHRGLTALYLAYLPAGK